jgi:polyhydroxybutyrate depolymerase
MQDVMLRAAGRKVRRRSALVLAFVLLASCQDASGHGDPATSSAAGRAGTEGAAGNGSGDGGPWDLHGPGTSGCGLANPMKSGNFAQTIDGTSRTYVLDVPSGYDTNHPYRLIFVWHPLMGSASQVVSSGYNGLKALANNSAVFVAADGLDGNNAEASGNGWWNVDGRDMKFLTAMLYRLFANLCIDQDRIFSTGFSFGGMMSYTVGYEFQVFRAIAPCSGDLQVIPHEETFTGPLAMMAFHGSSDSFVDTDRGRAARDQYLGRNHCGDQTKPAAPSPCVQYQGCDVPTLWCEFSGGHQPWSEEPQAIWQFFSGF